MLDRPGKRDSERDPRHAFLAYVGVGLLVLCSIATANVRAAGGSDAADARIAERVAALPAPVSPNGRSAAMAMPLGDRLYSASSPFNEPIPAGAALAPESATMVRGLEAGAALKGFVLTVGEWTVPTYVAGPTTPRQTVTLRKAPPDWNESPDYQGFPPGWSASLSTPLPGQLRGVPIPSGANPDPSLDAHMTILDPASGCEFDLYGAHQSAGGWQAVWANSTRIGGSGIYPAGMGPTAAGFAGDAGLIWPRELATGHIEHALLFAYPFTKQGGPVWPATSSDGRSTNVGAIPEGTRVRLDPKLNLDSLSLAPYQRTIAEALQKYGMILGDTGGAMGLFAVGRQSFTNREAYPMLPRGSFPDLSAIPINQFQVMASSTQTPKPTLQLQETGCGSFG